MVTVNIFRRRNCLGAGENNPEVLALSRTPTNRNSVVETKSMGTVLASRGCWDWPVMKRRTSATLCHPHTSSSALNLITWSAEECCLPWTRAGNSMYTILSIELCKFCGVCFDSRAVYQTSSASSFLGNDFLCLYAESKEINKLPQLKM